MGYYIVCKGNIYEYFSEDSHFKAYYEMEKNGLEPFATHSYEIAYEMAVD